MAFITFGFYLFLAAVVVLYYVFPLRFRWCILLAGSMAFYWYVGQFSLMRIGLMLGAAAVCWLAGILIKKGGKGKKLWLCLALIITTLPLLVIKEGPFLAQLAGSILPGWIAPVGIAFYTMQMISYVADVYSGKAEPEQNPLKFLLFVSFFPQIIQGPIPRYNQLAPQLLEGHRFEEQTFVKGFMLVLWGFFLKLCVADKAGIVVNAIFDSYPTYQGMYVLLAGVLYSFQLYADFLACTSFAQGIAALFGIELVDNFYHPYFATSIKDFWRRWHISLSSWLRDYIYIPLGGNRKGKLRKYSNLLLTFVVSGIWHGAGYKFVFWGLLHGLYQILGEVLAPVKKQLARIVHAEKHPGTTKIFQRLCTFCLVMLAWIIFRAEHLSTALSMIRSIFAVHNPWIFTNDALFTLGLGWKECVILLLNLFVLLVVSTKQEQGCCLREKILRQSLPVRWCIYIGIILYILVFGTYGYGYSAQAFIYGGF